MTTAPTINATGILTELRDILDQREELARQDKELSGRKAEIERQLIDYHDRSGLEQIAGGGLTVRFDPAATRCRYEPERWPDIVRWAVATDNVHIIQRRMTDAKILELVTNGTALPEGLTVESYTALSVRRK